MLLLFRKYRVLSTAMLLALYCFIAMPVQVWHKHTHAANTRFLKKAGQQSKSVIYAGKSYYGNCKLCAHQYPGYYNEQHHYQLSPVNIQVVQPPVFTFSINEQSLDCLFNKGPPALIA
jgi:hypothetical protein